MSKAAWTPRQQSPEDKRRELGRQLNEAREQVIYYRQKRVLATTAKDRADNGALVIAWSMTEEALESKLDHHNRRTPTPAGTDLTIGAGLQTATKAGRLSAH